MRQHNHLKGALLRSLTLVFTLALTLALTLAGCDNSSSGVGRSQAGAEGGASSDAGTSETAGSSGGGAGVMGGVEGGLSEEQRLAFEVAYIEASLSPQKALYSRQDRPQLNVTCFDEFGEELPTPALKITPRPDGLAEVSEGFEVSFFEEGQGALKVCVDVNRDVCGRVSFYVDDAPPKLTLTSPEPFAVISGEEDILVEGRAEGHTALLINDELTPTAPDGSFSVRLPASFGYNSIKVVADDGVQRPAPTVLRAPLFAPQLLPLNELGQLQTPAPLSTLFPQELFEASPPPAPAPGEPWRFYDFSQPLAHVLSQLELRSLINPVLRSSPNFNLLVSSINIERPEVSLWLVEGGIKLFIRLGALKVVTFGDVFFEGLTLSLNGEVELDVSAFAALSLTEARADGEVVMEVTDLGVALESMGGQMEDPTAQALLDTLTSALRVALGELAQSLVEELLNERLPGVVTNALSSSLSLFKEVPLSFDVPGQASPVEVELSVGLQELELRDQEGLYAHFEVGVSSLPEAELPPTAPNTSAVTGVPAHLDTPTPWPATPGSEAHVAIPLSIFNALLYQVWRQGSLSLELSALLPEAISNLTGITRLSLEALRPPLLINAPPGSPTPLRLSLEALILKIAKEPNAEPDRYALSITVPVGLEVTQAMNGQRGALTLTFPEGAQIRASFVSQGGAQPVIQVSSALQLLNTFVWEKLQALLGEGFSIPVPRATVSLGESINFGSEVNLSVEPVVSELLRVTDGWLMFSGGLLFEFAP